MILKSITFSEFENQPNQWHLKDCKLNMINLIVGINATGKSRTLNVIGSLGKMFANGKKFLRSSRYKVEFEDNNSIIKYDFLSNLKNIEEESLSIDGKTRFKRNNDGKGEIFAEQINQEIKFKIPVNFSTIAAKEDSVQHPFLDILIEWGINLRYYRFGTDLYKSEVIFVNKTNKVNENEKKHHQKTISILKYSLENHKEKYKELVINDMNEIGYDIEDIGLDSFSTSLSLEENPLFDANEISILFVKEKNILCKTTQITMSQGMYRALVLIIELNYHKFNQDQVSCILIDDIGEGLDFDRSKKLIELIIRKCKELGIQVIMTTNDRFVMNNVPLEYWIVLKRSGNTCTSLSYETSKKTFEKFELTGLSNFDFFTGKYYEEEI